MSHWSRRCLWALALSLPVCAAAEAQETATFLDEWLQAENPVRAGCTKLIHKKTGDKVELVALNPKPDSTVHAYKNKKTSEVIFGSSAAASGDDLALRKLDGSFIRVQAADYDELPANEVTDVAGKLKYIITDDYSPDPEKTDLRDAIVFIPISGVMTSHASVRCFKQGMNELIKSRPACVVVIVDSPGGKIALGYELCEAIQKLRRANIRCVAYVNGPNKMAMSCGAMVCLACDAIVMSPGSKMGAAIPINADMTDIKSDVHDKAVSSFAASFRALAAGAKFPPTLAAAMVDKRLGAVLIEANGKKQVLSRQEADALKAEYARNKMAFTEHVLCEPGIPASITAEEGTEASALGGVAETPRELAALIAPKNKKFAIYEPMDKFAQRAKPVMDKVELLNVKFTAASDRARRNGVTPDICTECIATLDKVLDIYKRNPDFFGEDDSKEVTELRAVIVERQRAFRPR